ncbi:fibronectin-binding protein [Geomicrobium sp. JCM 19037]|uniref:FusB/FusC family EF-G-binding protein n=1 Tax=Geomicrobium sp. JCM 19037 TaxID=1460634 RepID=UPI00045F3DFE|nr:elongation factor G-binding protein [Geomicrobium sp. JCM 19037]GAK05020.1 fibronectin-binding protein [Geomicrobium sp. JCM 19037]
MIPFIRNDQYNYIREQARTVVHTHKTVQDTDVKLAVQSLTIDKIQDTFKNLSDEQISHLSLINNVVDEETATIYLSSLHEYLIPFPRVTEQILSTLFPKAKVKNAPIQQTELTRISHFSWEDPGTQKRYIVAYPDHKHIGIEGTFSTRTVHGVCALCNHHGPQRLFTARKNHQGNRDTYTKKGNYICIDTVECNERMTSLHRLHEFVQRMT